MPTSPRRRIWPIVLLVAALAACGSDGKPSGASAARTFTLNEWAITPPRGPLPAGRVRITATNIGSEVHELVIVRAASAAALPTKADGSVDEDAIPDADTPGEIPDVRPGTTVTKALDLPAGHYLARCNLVDRMGSGRGMGNGRSGGQAMGHVHFRLGMVTSFTVG